MWRGYRSNLPTTNTERPVDAGRENLFAVMAGFTAGATGIGLPPGWRYTNSVTLGEAAPGTAALPAREYLKSGSGNTTKIIRRAKTYNGGGAATKITLSYSDDNGASWVNLTDADGNFVHNLTYVGADLTESTWGIA